MNKRELAKLLKVETDRDIDINGLCSNVVTSMRDVEDINIVRLAGGLRAVEFVYKSDTQDNSQIVLEDYYD